MLQATRRINIKNKQTKICSGHFNNFGQWAYTRKGTLYVLAKWLFIIFIFLDRGFPYMTESNFGQFLTSPSPTIVTLFITKAFVPSSHKISDLPLTTSYRTLYIRVEQLFWLHGPHQRQVMYPRASIRTLRLQMKVE